MNIVKFRNLKKSDLTEKKTNSGIMKKTLVSLGMVVYNKNFHMIQHMKITQMEMMNSSYFSQL